MGTFQDVNASANARYRNSEVVVTAAAGGTTFPAFPGRKAIALQNLGPNAIFVTVDGQAPLATGALGWRVGPVAEAPNNVLTLDVGPAAVIKAIAAVAAQVSPAATQVIEVG